MIKSFELETAKQLGIYVYRLVDPRNGETFYIGKGENQRVFEHINKPEDIGDKATTIREIQNKGMDVVIVIHRHFPYGGENEYTKEQAEKIAFEVEASLIDAYSGISNLQNGIDPERGCQSITEIANKYSAEEIIPHHNLIAFSIARSIAHKSLYNATRYAWKVDINKVQNRYVLAHERGLVRAVFQVEKWLKEGTAEFEKEFKDFPSENIKGKYGFIGKELGKESEIAKLYLGKRLPPAKKGAMMPFRYFDSGNL